MGKIPNGHAYSKLFEAAWIGNISAIEKMTINAPKGKQLIVNVTNFQVCFSFFFFLFVAFF